MKKSTAVKVFAFFGVLTMFLAGCKSDQFYQSRAADDAREFLLENSPELTADQVCYVRYNDPILLMGEGVGDPKTYSGRETSSSYIRQICIAWEIPGRNEIYMVCGFSEERMQYWKPNRLIRKKFQREAQAQDAMLTKTRRYLLNNLANTLTTAEINKIRFSYPLLVESDFDVNFYTKLDQSSADVAKIRDGVKKLRQYSLVWEIADRRVVFTGYSSPELTGWDILFAGILTPDEVTKHTLHVVKTPDDFNTRLIPEVK